MNILSGSLNDLETPTASFRTWTLLLKLAWAAPWGFANWGLSWLNKQWKMQMCSLWDREFGAPLLPLTTGHVSEERLEKVLLPIQADDERRLFLPQPPKLLGYCKGLYLLCWSSAGLASVLKLFRNSGQKRGMSLGDRGDGTGVSGRVCCLHCYCICWLNLITQTAHWPTLL